MALTINNIIGFETGGLEEVSATTGSPDATEAVVVRSGARSCKMAGAPSTPTFTADIVIDGASDQGNDHIVGFGFRLTDADPGNGTTMSILDGSTASSIHIGLRFNATNDLELIDNLGGVAGSVSFPFQINTWHYIEVYWQNVASGAAEVFIDNVSKIGPVSAKDFLGTGAVTAYEFLGPDSDFNNGDVYFDDIYIMTGATGASDRLGDAEVFKYQNITNSATPDVSALADDVLNAGTWHRAGETPLAETATNPEYTTTGTGVVYTDGDGFPQGPNTDSRIEGDSNIKAMKAISSMKRSGGGSTDHFINFGNDGGAASDLTKSADLDPPQSFDEYFVISEAAAILPTASEHCAIGFETTAGQDYECREQWAMILHVPTAPALTALSQADFPDQNYYVGPFEI